MPDAKLTATLAPPMARPERVGLFEMTVAITGPSAEAAARWSRRAETLAAWLLSEWQRDRAEAN